MSKEQLEVAKGLVPSLSKKEKKNLAKLLEEPTKAEPTPEERQQIHKRLLDTKRAGHLVHSRGKK